MDGLRLALLIVGLAILVGIVLYAWFTRARSRRADGLGTLDGDSYLENADFYDPVVSDVIDVEPPDPPVEELGGAFTPKRETSGADLSVDVSVLAGLRATYESTVGGDTIDAEDGAARAAPREFEPVPESPEPVPESPEPVPESPEPVPESPEPVPESPEPVPEAPEPVPEAPEPVPEAPEPVPEAPEPVPEAPEPVSGASGPAPEDLEPVPEPPGVERRDAGAETASRDSEPLVVDMTRPMVYLMLIAREHSLSGRTILESLDAEGFRPGALQLYYWQSESDPDVVVGVANLVEPGVLDPRSLPDMETPGLVTFMSIPADMSLALETFDALVEASRRLAGRIDAMVCDETQSSLTAQAENHLREKIADIVRRNRV